MRPARLRSLLVALLIVGVAVPVAHRAGATEADEPRYVDWTSLLPGLVDTYDPGSSNDCVAGRVSCIAAAVKEMERRFVPLADGCSHDAVFAMTYLRITQTYKWSVEQPGYYDDPRWMNHAVAVFAKYYLRAFDAWREGDPAAVPDAWRTAFGASGARRVSGSGNLMLGVNAHINRDLAFAMAAAGLAGEDGSKKRNFDTVNRVLNSATLPLTAELAARFDPSMQDSGSPYHLDSVAIGNVMFGWREQAWRNAEALVAAPTASVRATVSQQIEANSVVQAQAWLATSAYAPPLSSGASRDTWCAGHRWDRAPQAYPFGTPRR